MIFVTGDTHCPIDIHKLSAKELRQNGIDIGEGDYLIICGDAGFVWEESSEDEYWRKWISKKPFTTLFVDGNHENFDLLNKFPVTEWNGGQVHKITDKLIHLMRGQIYNIDNKSIFTMGGATSQDKILRTAGEDWWEEEIPDEEEINTAVANLKKHNNEVDYIITHCCSSTIQHFINDKYSTDTLTWFFENISFDIKFKKWFFGHYHIDKIIDNKTSITINNNYECLFEKIVKLY